MITVFYTPGCYIHKLIPMNYLVLEYFYNDL